MRRNEQAVLRIEDLRPNSKWFTIKVKVLEMGDEKVVFSRKDGSQHRVAEALVGDETGTVLFSLWDNDIDKVKELIGSTITVRNGFVTLYKGSMRLALGRFGSIEESDEEIEEVEKSVNVSERRFEINRPTRSYSRRS
ncbi:MAG: hypothetical protein RMI04_03115 [Thermofilaceae archaeon]|nr:hypothetical protein [Thermofilaceae archaeon]